MQEQNYLRQKDLLFIAGANGMVGSALVKQCQSRGFFNLLTPSHAELDLTQQAQVREFFQDNRPDVVIVAAAKVGGIYANSTYPAEFIYTNMMIAGNMIHQAHEADVKRLLYIGSTCIYPKLAPQPMAEETLLTAPLEPTNEAYAIAKIAGVKLCYYYRQQYKRRYISAMPTNLYGPGDNYHRENSHVLPALLRRFHEAKVEEKKEVVIWGTGKPQREFLFVNDLAEACLFLLDKYDHGMHINIGSDDEVTILELAHLVAEAVDYHGDISFDTSKPDGTPRKKTDTARINGLGWKAKTSLREGIRRTYTAFLSENSFSFAHTL